MLQLLHAAVCWMLVHAVRVGCRLCRMYVVKDDLFSDLNLQGKSYFSGCSTTMLQIQAWTWSFEKVHNTWSFEKVHKTWSFERSLFGRYQKVTVLVGPKRSLFGRYQRSLFSGKTL